MQQPNKQKDDGNDAKQMSQNWGTIRTHLAGYTRVWDKCKLLELVMTLKFLVLLSGVILQSYKSFSFDKVHKRENCLIFGFGILNDEETFIFSKHLCIKIK